MYMHLLSYCPRRQKNNNNRIQEAFPTATAIIRGRRTCGSHRKPATTAAAAFTNPNPRFFMLNDRKNRKQRSGVVDSCVVMVLQTI